MADTPDRAGGDRGITVVLKRASYEYETLKPVVFSILGALGDEEVGSGRQVVIKPNLLAPAPPEKAMLTHPLVVRAVVEYVLSRGGRPVVSDSPAVGAFQRVLRESGIAAALKGLAVECREFSRSRVVDVGPPFHKIDVAEDVMKADAVINLPKLKTHSQMLLTLGVKNLFGCVVGLKKPEWHLRTGVDRDMFARLLVQVHQAVRPTFTLLDGVLAMEGQGPGKSGTPRHLGILMGGRDAVALDHSVCMLLNIEPGRLFTNRAARDLGLAPEFTVEGDLAAARDFRLPIIGPVLFGPPALHGLMRRHLIQRPVVDETLCTRCGECRRFCPAGAIPGGRRVDFEYGKCIRCFCCLEVCPHGAISSRETGAGKVVRRILKA